MARDLDELLGSVPVPGEDPRFADREVFLVDDGAETTIEDNDSDPLDVDETPYMPGAVDDDGSPGMRPFVDANKKFEEVEGLEADREKHSGDEILGDEFKDNVRLHHAAGFDRHGRPVSDIAALAQVQKMRQQSLRTSAPFVRINPESASKAVLGNLARLTTNSVRGPIEVAIWSAESDVESTAVTVQFVPLPVVLPTAELVGARSCLRPYGIINFGTRGRYQAEVDIGQGVQLTLNASEVSLQVAFDSSSNTTDQLSMDVAGMLSFLPSVRTSPLLRTRYIDSLAADATSSNILIPPFAKTLMFVRTVSIPVTINILSENTTIFSYSLAANTSQADPVWLPGDAKMISVENDNAGGGTALTSGRAIFELGL